MPSNLIWCRVHGSPNPATSATLCESRYASAPSPPPSPSSTSPISILPLATDSPSSLYPPLPFRRPSSIGVWYPEVPSYPLFLSSFSCFLSSASSSLLSSSHRPHSSSSSSSSSSPSLLSSLLALSHSLPQDLICLQSACACRCSSLRQSTVGSSLPYRFCSCQSDFLTSRPSPFVKPFRNRRARFFYSLPVRFLHLLQITL